MDRRRFLAVAPALGLAARAVSDMPAEAEALRAPTLPLEVFGVQLYTLRSAMADDVDRTLAVVAEIGYRQVEFAGLYNLSPPAMRQKLDNVGLSAVSSHHSVNEIRGNWGAFLEGAQELGQALVVVPSIPQSEQNAEGIRRVADDFNRAAATARSAGLRFGYHNHSWEFDALPDGTLMMDLLLERTDPSLVDWQMDIYWTVDGGGDPMAYLESEAGRVTSVHVKDRTADGRMVDVGDGVIDFATILPRAEELGLRFALVEHDTPTDPIGSIRKSYATLERLGL
jgi:sugar phosphate isomerase/epimerase